MDDLLQSRLERLAPPVDDVDGALAGVHAAGRRRRVRRRGIGGAAMVAVVAVLFSAVVLNAGDGEDASVVAGDTDGPVPIETGPDTSVTPTVAVTTIAAGTPAAPEPATTDASPPAPVAPPDQLATTIVPVPDAPRSERSTAAFPPEPGQLAAPSEVEIVITAERPAVSIGERVRVRVEVVNHSARPARLVGGGVGCGPIGVTGTGEGLGAGWPGQWEGATSLTEYVATRDLAPSRTPVPVGSSVSRVGMVCPAIETAEELGAGARIEETFVWDPIVRATWSPAASDLTMVAAVRVSATPGFGGPSDLVSASTTVHVADDARAHAPRDPLIAAVATNATIQGWLVGHGAFWDVHVGFANGATELWFVGDGAGLRVRGDAATGTIAEIRALHPSYAPGDDPDSTFKDPNEQILFRG